MEHKDGDLVERMKILADFIVQTDSMTREEQLNYCDSFSLEELSELHLLFVIENESEAAREQFKLALGSAYAADTKTA